MKIVRRILKENIYQFQKCRFIIVQHLLTDTYRIITLLLENKIEIVALLVKSYSIDTSTYEKTKPIVFTEILSKENNKDICYQAIMNAIKLSKRDHKKIVILDLGGEYADIINQIDANGCSIVIVEDTAFGHRKYEKIASKTKNIQFFSVAQSHMKEIEAKFVGNSIAYTTERVFKSIGQTVFGSNVLVLGYGMIGSNVAKTFRDLGCKVSVYDIDYVKLCHAYFEGFFVDSFHNLLNVNPIIVGTTGKTSLTKEDLLCSKRKTFYLVSGSSKQIEFSKDIIVANEPILINEHIKEYNIENKKIYLFNDGYPINFLTQSIPDSIIELLFSEMFFCVLESFSSINPSCLKMEGASKESLEKIAMLFFQEKLY